MPISNLLIKNILGRIRSMNEYDEDDIDMMRYSLQSILWEVEKIIILLILFSLMGKTFISLVSMFALMSIRTNAGGYHSKSSLTCFLSTFFIFFFAIIVLPLIPLNTLGLLSVCGISFLITAVLAPIPSKERESLIKMKRSTAKVLALIMVVVWSVVVFIFPESIYSKPILWSVFLQNAQLLFEYIRRKVIMQKEKVYRANIPS
ncbi:MAG: accessory gene regulator B family protein [Lachnoclostridium sp.]|nr:accessory gene regulator B family protein [Lachnoclostridium sp.]